MNPTTFNNRFERIIKASHFAPLWPQWSKSPLFVHHMHIDDAISKADDYVTSHPEVATFIANDAFAAPGSVPSKKKAIRFNEFPLPYPMLRVELRIQYEEELAVVQAFAKMEGDEYRLFVISKQQPEFAMEIGTNDTNLKVGIWNAETGLFLDAEMLMRRSSEETRREIDRASTHNVSLVTAFAIDATQIGHVAEVRPNKPGKSVEWVQARQHFVILSKAHPANNADRQQGERIVVDDKKELTRMAHGRRAHYRVLKSPRYTRMRGHRVFVRSTWCGPKEWQDEGGKQIYRIIEPIALEKAA